MRIALLILLFAVDCFAQGVVPNRRRNFQPVAGGGGGAPALETWSTNGSAASVSILTKSITNGGTSRLQFVIAGLGAGSDYQVGTVTNSTGQSFTKAWNRYDGAWTGNEGWYLINPPTGSNLVTVTMLGGGTPNQLHMIVANYTNVNQVTPIGTSVTATNSTGNPAVTVTSATGELVVGGATTDGENSLNVSGGTAVSIIKGLGSDTDCGMGYWTGAASVGANWTATAAMQWSAGGVSLKP